VTDLALEMDRLNEELDLAQTAQRDFVDSFPDSRTLNDVVRLHPETRTDVGALIVQANEAQAERDSFRRRHPSFPSEAGQSVRYSISPDATKPRNGRTGTSTGRRQSAGKVRNLRQDPYNPKAARRRTPAGEF